MGGPGVGRAAGGAAVRAWRGAVGHHWRSRRTAGVGRVRRTAGVHGRLGVCRFGRRSGRTDRGRVGRRIGEAREHHAEFSGDGRNAHADDDAVLQDVPGGGRAKPRRGGTRGHRRGPLLRRGRPGWCAFSAVCASRAGWATGRRTRGFRSKPKGSIRRSAAVSGNGGRPSSFRSTCPPSNRWLLTLATGCGCRSSSVRMTTPAVVGRCMTRGTLPRAWSI